MKTFFVVMAGGPGSRLWPESRRAFPKPFLPLLPDGRSLFRATLDRVKAISEDGVIVVTGRPFEEHVRAAAPEIAPERILLEPEGRDTAPCVAWAALEALRADEDRALSASASKTAGFSISKKSSATRASNSGDLPSPGPTATAVAPLSSVSVTNSPFT